MSSARDSYSWLTFGIFVRHDLVVEIGIKTTSCSEIRKSVVRIHKIPLPTTNIE